MTTTPFDILLGCLFPAALLIVAYRLRDTLWSTDELYSLIYPGKKATLSANQYYSLDRAYFAYLQYLNLSHNDVRTMRTSYGSLPRVHKNLGYKIGYPQKLEQLWKVTSMNAVLAEDIADLAASEFPELKHATRIQATSGDLARVRESLKHFVRDWSAAGAHERQKTFSPVLDLLRVVPADQRANKRILVPGSGLGRLAWEISRLGFDTTANELSFFMTLAFRFLLSPKTTQTAEQHTIRPYAHWFSHQRSNENLFRGVSFPDVVPRLSTNFHLLEQDFLKLPRPVPGGAQATPDFWKPSPGRTEPEASTIPPETGFDYIVTLFFIDTSFNVFATMDQIFALLKPGGVWVNLGPLLWPSGGQCKLELSLEELLAAAEEIGFILERPPSVDGGEGNPEDQRTVECEYTSDPNAMMRWSYKTEFWVARKPS